MKSYSYRERDYAFAQLMLTLRTSIGLTQAGLAERLGVSRRAVAEWEGGLSYPKAERLKQLITLGVQQKAFAAGREEEEIRALWRAAHQKVLLDDAWLHDLLASPRPVQLAPPAGTLVAPADLEPAGILRIDWVGALDTSHFAGREVEVAVLSAWIVQERCRLIALLGIGGIGKSMLASYLGQHLAPQFEAVLWRSVRDAPSCEELVADCITFFSEKPPAAFPTSLEQRISQLLSRLQAHRCLLVLDNLETLLASGDPAGGYLPDYEGYGRLIGRLAESAHQSCVLLTSREKPKEIAPLEGVRAPVRSLRLAGVDEQAAKALLSDKELRGTPAAWQRLVASYAGNPLALKIVAQVVSDLFNGELDRFLSEGELIFNGIRPVLRQQVGRLSPLEHLLLTWLAVLREWTKLDTLSQVLHPRVLRAQLLEAHLLGLLAQFRAEDDAVQGYGPANVISLLKALRGHLRGLDLSRLSIRGAYLQGVEMQDATLAGATLHEVVFTQAFDAVLSVARSPDGRYFAAGSNSGQVRVWREEGQVAHLTMRGHSDRVGAIAFSPDGHTLATASWDGTVRLWDVESGAIIWTAREQQVPVTSIAMSPTRKLLSGGYDGAIHVWELRTGTHLKSLPTQGRPIFTVAWSTDGRLLASGGLDAVIGLWDAEQGTRLWELPGHRDPIITLAFAPQMPLLASGSIDQVVKLWDVETGTCRRTLEGHTGVVSGLAFSPDGRILASASYDTTIRLWDGKTGQCRHILQGHRDAVTSVAFLLRGDRLLSGSYDHTVRTWDVTSGQHVRTMAGYALAVFALCWSPDGRFLLSGSSEATLTLWNVTTRAPVQVLRGHRQRVNAIAWSRAANRIASGSQDQTVRIWDAETGACTQILQGHTDAVYSVDWSVDGSFLASGGYDGSVRIWDVQADTSRVGREHAGLVNAAVWSPDGRLLASAGEEGLVQIWRAADGDLLRRFEHAGVVGALCWSPNGEQLVSGAVDGEKGVLYLWDVRDGTLVRRLEGHRGFIGGIEWSRAHKLLVSAGADGTVRWWNPEQGTNLATVQAHDAWARAVRVSPDGKTVASCGEDGVIGLWDMQSHQHLATLRADQPYERLDISHTRGLTHAQQAALRALGAIESFPMLGAR